MSNPKTKYPMDLTPEESEALTAGAAAHGTNKKALIFSALKIAYGIEPGKPIPAPGKQQNTTTKQPGSK